MALIGDGGGSTRPRRPPRGVSHAAIDNMGADQDIIDEIQRRRVEANSRAGVREQGSLEQANQFRDYNKLKQSAEDAYTPLDLYKQVTHYPVDLYKDADSMVRGLIDLGGNTVSNVANDQAPFEGIEADPIIEDTIHNWTHPVEYANEHPAAFLMDLAGGTALGGKALSSAAARGGFPDTAAFLSDETGAIGDIGRRLEAGEVPLQESVSPGMIPTYQGTAASPDLSVLTFPDEYRGLGVVKQRQPGMLMDQPKAEIAASDLNRLTGGRVRMPGVQGGNWEYTPRVTEYNQGFEPITRFDAPKRGPGALIEYVHDLKPVNDASEFDFTNPAVREQMRSLNIFDEVIGNNDRGYGANMFSSEGLPTAVDQGAAFGPGDYTMVEPRVWEGGGRLNPSELEWVRNMERVAPSLDVSPIQIRTLVDRIRRILEEGKLHPW